MKINRWLQLGAAWLWAAGGAGFAAEAIYVAPGGSDVAAGTRAAPFATIARARQEARRFARKEPVNVFLRDGTYYLDRTLVFTAEDSGSRECPIVYAAAPGEHPVVSGGVRLQLDWKAAGHGVMEAAIPPGLEFTLLFVNGEREDLARFPNRVAGMPVLGCFSSIEAKAAAGAVGDALSPQRVARWSDPAGGYVRGLQDSAYGSTDGLILGKNADGTLRVQFSSDSRGDSWQSCVGSGFGFATFVSLHPVLRYVEGIAEELDAPGEWFLDRRRHVLRFIPTEGLDLAGARVEVAQLDRLVEFSGTAVAPVRFITLRGITFRHANRTFMSPRQPLAFSDWMIYRNGAIFYNGAEDCALEGVTLEQLGGTAVFINDYNRRIAVRGCYLHGCGGGGVDLIGDPETIWGPRTWGARLSVGSVELTPGAKTSNYPADCIVDDCLITGTGLDEKQTAGVDIDIAARITVRHCSIYDVPRAGINIGTGYFGGHLVDGCDVFDTVQETDDHGSFNSWGRSRYWWTSGGTPEQLRALATLDAVAPSTLRNSRWRCDKGWDIDLDDGSSNFVITHNLLLHGGLKLREGFLRTATNNVIVGNSLHPHCWYPNSGDIFRHNLVFGAYRPAGGMPVTHWGDSIGRNLFTSSQADRLRFASVGCDADSIVADPQFVNAAAGDFRVRPGSPALAVGFENFPMNQFGVQRAWLRALARTPAIPSVQIHPDQSMPGPAAAQREIRWYDAEVRDLAGEEFSAYGVTRGSGGIVVVAVSPVPPAAASGLRRGDLIRSVNGQPVGSVAALAAFLSGLPDDAALRVAVIHVDQSPDTLMVRGGVQSPTL